ncbi:MAG: hypothetical protein Q9161_008617 [Pseudevernia consocians]
MTSKQNKKLPKLEPKNVIGTARGPKPRDLRDRRLQGLPDPDSEVVLRRAALELEQAALGLQQTILESLPVSDLRESLTVLADPEAPWSDSDWDTTTEAVSDTDTEDEEAIEDAFIAKVRDVETREVTAARGAPVLTSMQAFVKKVRTVRGRESAAAAAAAPDFTTMQPGTTRELTVADAALALTNGQARTNVTMEDLRTGREVENLERDLEEGPGDTYRFTVGSVGTRELTVAEAALVLTNMQAGTDLTMQDLRTSREMVDLWDNEDIYHWTVGNVE